MSITETYVKQARETVKGATQARLRDAKAVFKLVPRPGNDLVNPGEAFGQSARLTKRLVDVNVEYVRDLAGAVRKHMTGLADVLKDEAVTTVKIANSQAEKVEEVALEQAEEIQRAERTATRRAKKAAHDAAATQYQEMTKVELADELEKRNLHKTGNVEELRDRLIENDLETATA